MITNIYEQLLRDEGFRAEPYSDTRGFSTVGIGHNLNANPLSGEVYPMSYDRAMEVLKQDVTRIWLKLLGDLPWITKLDAVREGVLLNLTFNIGAAGEEAFHHMLSDVQEGNYEKAASDLENSLWYTQVGDRAKRLVLQMRTGMWQ